MIRALTTTQERDRMTTAVATVEKGAVLTAADMRAQINLIQEVMRATMKENVHYGTIPGTPKRSLWKPGAEVLCAVFRIAPSYRLEDLSTDDVVRYRVVCVGTHQTSGIMLGEGLGEASSNEQKYKWVKAYRREWDGTPGNRRRIKYGYDKQKREEYEIFQVRTEPADIANTVLKMAAKRAQVAMTLNVTAASDIFTQDVEDLPEELQREVGERGGGEDGATATEQKGYKRASPKGGAAAKPSTTGGTMTVHATATVSGGSEPVKTSENGVEYATEGMIAHFTKKIEAAGSTWGKELMHAKLAPDSRITKAQCQQMLNNAMKPGGGSRQPTPEELDFARGPGGA